MPLAPLKNSLLLTTNRRPIMYAMTEAARLAKLKSGATVIANENAQIRVNPVAADDTREGVVYYVRTDGSDSNTGLTNDAEGAFATTQRAIEVANANGQKAKIMIADGTYSGAGVAPMQRTRPLPRAQRRAQRATRR